MFAMILPKITEGMPWFAMDCGNAAVDFFAPALYTTAMGRAMRNTTRETVFRILDEHRGTYVSGTEIADMLSISHQAVQKAAHALIQDGCPIRCVKNKGYMLPEEADILSANILAFETGARVILLDTTDSTSKVAEREYAAGGKCLVVAREQTQGRRKDGGTFPSPKDKGVYISMALPLRTTTDRMWELRRLCGQIAREVVLEAGAAAPECRNTDEVFVNERKVAGVLIQYSATAASAVTDHVVIGIGIYTFDGDRKTLQGTRMKMISSLYERVFDAVSAMDSTDGTDSTDSADHTGGPGEGLPDGNTPDSPSFKGMG